MNRQTRQGQKYLWLLPEENNQAVLEFAKTFSLSPAICQKAPSTSSRTSKPQGWAAKPSPTTC